MNLNTTTNLNFAATAEGFPLKLSLLTIFQRCCLHHNWLTADWWYQAFGDLLLCFDFDDMEWTANDCQW